MLYYSSINANRRGRHGAALYRRAHRGLPQARRRFVHRRARRHAGAAAPRPRRAGDRLRPHRPPAGPAGRRRDGLRPLAHGGQSAVQAGAGAYIPEGLSRRARGRPGPGIRRAGGPAAPRHRRPAHLRRRRARAGYAPGTAFLPRAGRGRRPRARPHPAGDRAHAPDPRAVLFPRAAAVRRREIRRGRARAARVVVVPDRVLPPADGPAAAVFPSAPGRRPLAAIPNSIITT